MRKIDFKQKLKEAGLRITPQRIAVMEALLKNSHPTAEKIIEDVQKEHPNIAVGTIYNILDTFVRLNIINKVNTENSVTRYDPITERHHHLYAVNKNLIEDYYDEKLSEMILNYLKKSKIPNFKVKDFKLQLIGEFNGKKKETGKEK